jgi:hypothetical protein
MNTFIIPPRVIKTSNIFKTTGINKIGVQDNTKKYTSYTVDIKKKAPESQKAFN